jgi:hypothetical protein
MWHGATHVEDPNNECAAVQEYILRALIMNVMWPRSQWVRDPNNECSVVKKSVDEWS